MSGCHSLLVHTASESFNVITDIIDHAVPLVTLWGLLAFVWGGTSSACSVAIGGGVWGRAGCAPVTTEAVCNDASSILHTDGFKEILKVLAVLLWYKGTQACRSTLQHTWSLCCVSIILHDIKCSKIPINEQKTWTLTHNSILSWALNKNGCSCTFDIIWVDGLCFYSIK